jgi:hypothetical protein
MIEIAIAEVFIKAAVLCFLLYIVARHEADFSFQKVAMVVAGITLAAVLLDAILKPYIGYFSAIPIAVASAALIVRFCWVNWPKAILVTAIFLAINIGLGLAAGALFKRLEENSGALTRAHEKDIEEAKGFLQEVFGGQHPAVSVPAGTSNPVPVAAAELPPGTNAATAVAAPPPAVVPAPTAQPATDVSGIEPADDEPGWTAAQAKLILEGVFSGGGQKMAKVNGRFVEEGSSIRVSHDGRVYRFRVKSIERGAVQWVRETSAPAPTTN